MYKLIERQISASEIAEYLNTKIDGKDFVVTGPASSTSVASNSFIFTETSSSFDLAKLAGLKSVLLITGDAFPDLPSGIAQIVSTRPKLDFFRVINELFLEVEERRIHETAIISHGAQLGRNVLIESWCYVGPDVILGDNAIVMKNAVLNGKIEIGRASVIKSGAVIGSEGYNFVLDEDNAAIHCPPLGKIVIGANVWIGSQTTVEQAFMSDTVVEDNVKIDDLVHIGAGCRIGANSMITSGAVLSVNVVIGKSCWLAPNVSVAHGVSVGSNVTIGLGAVVITDLSDNGVYVGNPARFIRKQGDIYNNVR